MRAVHRQRAVGDDNIRAVVVGIVEADGGVVGEGDRPGCETMQQQCCDRQNEVQRNEWLFHKLI